MPKIARGILLMSVGLLLFGLASTIDAQQQPHINYKPELKTIVEQTLKKTIDERSRKIQEWEWDAKVTLGLAVTIGLLGVLAGLLQAKTSPLARNLTIIVGATISVIVVINENVYNKDHRSLKALAIEGRHYLNQIQNIVDFDIHLVHNDLDLLK